MQRNNRGTYYGIFRNKFLSKLFIYSPNFYWVHPIIGVVAQIFREIVGVLDMRVAYYVVNKLRNIIKAHKNPFPNLCKKNVVYKLNCNNCKTTYVGQTKRQLKTRDVR